MICPRCDTLSDHRRDHTDSIDRKIETALGEIEWDKKKSKCIPGTTYSSILFRKASKWVQEVKHEMFHRSDRQIIHRSSIDPNLPIRVFCVICIVQIHPRKHVLRRSCRLNGFHPATWARSYRSCRSYRSSALKSLLIYHAVGIDDLSCKRRVELFNVLSITADHNY